jgi:riboflavin kinase/FMN adenylyltransferase
MEPEDFIERIVHTFKPTHIVEGATFGFGRKRRGTPELLRALGEELGFETCIINPVELTLPGNETVTVSSSVIRKLVAEGRVHLAALSLGRPYTLSGKVVSGDGRGADLGFPTANVAGIECLVPGDGVYAGSARVGGSKCLAGISIGSNPTFDGHNRKVEAHLLDFHQQIGRWLRPQRAFRSADELRSQIDTDVQAVRAQGADSAAAPFRRRGAPDGEAMV